jgi:pimeloyl-ACP methyl ester carboxylesterase
MRHLLLAPVALLLAAAPAAAEFRSDRITVTVEGQGPDVVLIPGLTSSPRIWKGTAAAIPGYRYHFVQVQGFAGTAPGGNLAGGVVAPVAEEIARYLREAKLARPAVIGHSMGGTLGMLVAARHPELVGKLMVVDMVPFMGQFFGGPNATPESLKPVVEAMSARTASLSDEDKAKERAAMLATMVKSDTERAGPIEDATKSDSRVVNQAYTELVLLDLRPELAKIKAPTTVAYVNPGTMPVTDAQMDGFYKAAYANLAGAKLVRVPDSFHFIMLDQPQRFQADVKAFLQQ